MGTRAWAVVLMLAAGPVAACSDGDGTAGPRGGADHEDVVRILNDDDATPAEIADAGEEVDSDTFEGRTVTTYRLADPGDGGETPSLYAWRLRGGSGDLIAEGATRYSMVVSVFPDGFLILNGGSPRLQHLEEDGTPRPVPIGRARPTRPGDALVLQGGLFYAAGPTDRSIAYRPGRGGRVGTAALLPQAPAPSRYGPVIQQDALASDGTLWVRKPEDRPQRDPAEVLWSRDGRPPWRTTRLPIPAASFAVGQLTAIGTDVYLFSARGWIGGGERIESLWVTRAGGRWREIPLTGIPRRKGDADPAVAMSADGTLEVSVEYARYYQDGNRFVPLPSD